MSAEQQLWRAVINQALVDARKTHVSTWQEEERFAPQIARDWFKGNSAHFRFVCEAAGYNPDYVRDKALKMIAGLRLGSPTKPLNPTPSRRTIKRREARSGGHHAVA